MTETANPQRRKGKQAGPGQRPDDRACLQHARHPPLRRDHLGASRRRPAELEDRRDRLRAARRGVPRLLVGQRLARSSPRSTSAAPSAPRCASGASSSSIDRVVTTYTKAGVDHGYFATPERRRDLRARAHLAAGPPVLLVQLPGLVQRRHGRRPQQVSACFILSVDDSMDSILNWYKEEGFIFKGGSGAGLNLSRIRSSKELLSSGGTASGPVSFMRGADASAGTIKSGGATRRAAKMVVLDVDHPDIVEFVETKAREEDKIRALRDAGFDMDLGGADITSVQYQNANNSVRVSDEFMRAVEDGTSFGLRAPQDPRGDRDRRRPRAVHQDQPRPRGSAPTRACSTTTRSTTGTPTPRPAGSPRPTRARSTCRSTTPRATSPASTC